MRLFPSLRQGFAVRPAIGGAAQAITALMRIFRCDSTSGARHTGCGASFDASAGTDLSPHSRLQSRQAHTDDDSPDAASPALPAWIAVFQAGLRRTLHWPAAASNRLAKAALKDRRASRIDFSASAMPNQSPQQPSQQKKWPKPLDQS